jgi:hypothetical protein
MLHGVATPIATLLRAQVATITIVAALCEAALDPTEALVRRVAAMLVRDPARTAAREPPQASAAARPRLVVPEQRVGSAAHRVQDHGLLPRCRQRKKDQVAAFLERRLAPFDGAQDPSRIILSGAQADDATGPLVDEDGDGDVADHRAHESEARTLRFCGLSAPKLQHSSVC